MKKVICIILSAVLTLALSITAFATESDSSGRDDNDSHYDYTLQATLSSEEYAQMLEMVSNCAKNAITPGLIEKVKDLRQSIETSEFMQKIKNDPETRASYDSVTLEALLCSNDGLSLIEITMIGLVHAGYARDEAIELYEDQGPDVEMKRDAFRHMTWNFRSAKAYGRSKTRIATINHEWAEVILPAVTAYESERYSYYLNLYYNQVMWGILTISDITNMAKAEADAYAITYRDNLINQCQGSFSVFNSVFAEPRYIMDFWNNKFGRDYAFTNPNSTTDEVFVMAWNANELIKHEGATAVTSSKRATLFLTDWWYIT